MNILYTQRPKVLERDIDRVLINHLRDNKNFASVFVNHIACQVGRGLAFDGVGVDAQVAHTGAPGTIDICVRLWLQAGLESGRLLIENKLDSTFTSNQPERYAASASVNSKPERPVLTVLCAPKGYLSRSRYAGSFQAHVSYENIVDWLDGEDREKLLAAIARFEMPYEPDPVPEVAEFFEGYQELVRQFAPELILKRNPNTSEARPSGSYTIYFDARKTLPQHAFLPTLSMSHQCQDKAAPSPGVKVLFRTWAKHNAVHFAIRMAALKSTRV